MIPNLAVDRGGVDWAGSFGTEYVPVLFLTYRLVFLYLCRQGYFDHPIDGAVQVTTVQLALGGR
jgi:hypothetical protein